MCLGIPMQILSIDGTTARCSANGVEREVSLFLLQDRSLNVHDFVMVHVGYAIEQVQEVEARSVWQLHDQMIALVDKNAADKKDA